MNVIATKQKIIDAAIVVFNEDLSAPLEKVAEKAAVTRRTLHRYFKDRAELIAFCEDDMQKKCRKAMTEAFNSSSNPLKQLENMLYAGIDCGAKYSFFHKLHHREGHKHNANNPECAEYDILCNQYRQLILALQNQEIISRQLTVNWILTLFSGVLSAINNAGPIDEIAKNDLKQFAWFSFSKGIGL